jgi:hypothetical protein
MPIAWSEQLGCITLDGVPLGMPGYLPSQGELRSVPKPAPRAFEEMPESLSDPQDVAADAA